ncbi:MAG: DinB family protein [Candidatus Limnocylindrales bacterium]
MDRSPDPITEVDAYRTSLLEALGGDPVSDALAEAPAMLRQVVADAGDLLRVRPEPGEWSVLECVAHITDAELVASARVRWMLAEREPDIVGYDQALWVDRLGHNEDDPEVLLGLFESLRRANLDLWRRTPVPARGRFGMHRERGREDVDLTVRMAAGHHRIHLAQARRALDTLRSR